MSRYRRRRRSGPRPWWRSLLDGLVVIVLAGSIIFALDLIPGSDISANMIAVDGDSLRPKDGSADIRLHGIDAPELAQRCKSANGKDYACGRRARDNLRRLIASRTVECRTVDADRYGRSVAICHAGKTELNRQMVRDGWALAYRQHDHTYVRDELSAQDAKRGIWQGSFERPELWRRINLGTSAPD